VVAAHSCPFLSWFCNRIFVPVAKASIAELFPAKRGECISLFSSVTYVCRVIACTHACIPFIPTEAEIDQFIAGCGRKISAFLQTAKETAARSGEI